MQHGVFTQPQIIDSSSSNLISQQVMLAELEMEAEALDTVDPGVVAEYKEAQEVKINLGFCFKIVTVLVRWR